MRSFGIVEDKLAETDFFVDKIEEAGSDLFAAQCYLSAFMSSARSVTFAIQASIGDLDDFDVWYSNIQTKMKNDCLAKHFLKCRNESVHIGLTHIRSGQMLNGEYKYYFQSLFEQDWADTKEDVLSACKKHLRNLVEYVYQCFEHFGYDIDPDMYYTIQNARRKNKTVEDFEVELGFPEGWTKVEGFGDEKRMRLLREQQPPLEVDYLFEKHLGKSRLSILQREDIA